MAAAVGIEIEPGARAGAEQGLGSPGMSGRAFRAGRPDAEAGFFSGSPAQGVASFRSSWQSQLASLGAGQDANLKAGENNSATETCEAGSAGNAAAESALAAGRQVLQIPVEDIPEAGETGGAARWTPVSLRGAISPAMINIDSAGERSSGATEKSRTSNRSGDSTSGADVSRSGKSHKANAARSDGVLAAPAVAMVGEAMAGVSLEPPVPKAQEVTGQRAARDAQAGMAAGIAEPPGKNGLNANATSMQTGASEPPGRSVNTKDSGVAGAAGHPAAGGDAFSLEKGRPQVEANVPAEAQVGNLTAWQGAEQGTGSASAVNASDATNGGDARDASGPQCIAALAQGQETAVAADGKQTADPASLHAARKGAADQGETEKHPPEGWETGAAPDSFALVHDVAGSRGTFNAAGGDSGSTGGVAGVPQERETFTVLDAGTGMGTPGWIHAGAQRAEAGFQDPALGWVGVRADLSGGSVHASLVPGSPEAAQALSGHLAGLSAHLTEQHAAVETVTVAAPYSGDTRWAGGQGSHQGAHQGSYQGSNQGSYQGSGQNPQQGAYVHSQETTGPAGTTISSVGNLAGSRPSVASGTGNPPARSRGKYISVMA